jgi:hypothetical protein
MPSHWTTIVTILPAFLAKNLETSGEIWFQTSFEMPNKSEVVKLPKHLDSKKKITVERYTHNVAIEKNDEPVEKWGSCSRAEDLGPKSSSCSTAWMGIPIYNHVYIYIHMILYDFI